MRGIGMYPRNCLEKRIENIQIIVIDVIEILTESPRPRKYWSALKTKLQQEGSELSHKLGQLKMAAEDGKLRDTDVANTEQLLRLIQSIPSPKAEPFKQWLAQVGYQRMEEIENPEYSILTAEISKATFGLTPSAYKNLKGFDKPKENLWANNCYFKLLHIQHQPL
jgi:DNA-damage-inducible protein D